jgi:hypothetical protein
LDTASYYAQNGSNWNIRYLHCLDDLGLELKPEEWRDLTGQGNDFLAPQPDPRSRVTWPVSRIGVKE